MRLLQNLDPTRVLSRGYALVKKAGVIVVSTDGLEVGEDITVQFARGKADAGIRKIY